MAGKKDGRKEKRFVLGSLWYRVLMTNKQTNTQVVCFVYGYVKTIEDWNQLLLLENPFYSSERKSGIIAAFISLFQHLK